MRGDGQVSAHGTLIGPALIGIVGRDAHIGNPISGFDEHSRPAGPPVSRREDQGGIGAILDAQGDAQGRCALAQGQQPQHDLACGGRWREIRAEVLLSPAFGASAQRDGDRTQADGNDAQSGLPRHGSADARCLRRVYAVGRLPNMTDWQSSQSSWAADIAAIATLSDVCMHCPGRSPPAVLGLGQRFQRERPRRSAEGRRRPRHPGAGRRPRALAGATLAARVRVHMPHDLSRHCHEERPTAWRCHPGVQNNLENILAQNHHIASALRWSRHFARVLRA
jgi:hypothetical protein